MTSPDPWPRDLWQVFLKKVEARLEVGAKEYGERSFLKKLPNTIDDILEELMDVMGWGFILWVRIKRLQDKLAVWEKNVERHLPES